MSARILIVLVSGPEDLSKAKEALGLAQSIHEIGMAAAVQVLLVGEGVRCISSNDPESVDAREALERLVEACIPVAACTGSLAQHQLLDEVAHFDGVEPVGAPVFLSDKATEGWVMLTF